MYIRKSCTSFATLSGLRVKAFELGVECARKLFSRAALSPVRKVRRGNVSFSKTIERKISCRQARSTYKPIPTSA
ncbi:hypothetical protein D6817_03565 [Candidatus Pacearchaeota archaeon]|nr:MAG: hypothetical protein D6817_03565 [Candidatus Pacearchaeota archaeon]